MILMFMLAGCQMSTKYLQSPSPWCITSIKDNIYTTNGEGYLSIICFISLLESCEKINHCGLKILSSKAIINQFGSFLQMSWFLFQLLHLKGLHWRRWMLLLWMVGHSLEQVRKNASLAVPYKQTTATTLWTASRTTRSVLANYAL